MAIQIGDKAPEILGLDQNGKEIKLSDFKGKKLALYFYPKDNTSGCTAEACSLRDGYKELQAASAKTMLGPIRDLSQNRNFPSASSLIRIRPCNSSSGFGQKRNCTDVHTWGLSVPPLL